MAVSHEHRLEAPFAALVEGRNRDPFAVLGPHKDDDGIVVRAFQPAARSIELRVMSTGELAPMTRVDPSGLFEVRLEPDTTTPDTTDYRLRITFSADHALEIDDPYRYGRVLTDFDLHLLGEGTQLRAFDKLGAHRIRAGSTVGIHFAVWAPNADRVSVVGDFNGWDGRVHPMRLLSPSGIWEIFIPDLPDGERYKYEIRTAHGEILKKTDPFGVAFEVPPLSASLVRDISGYRWSDADWMAARPDHNRWLDR
ncbi:MAG TPA: hypothetical protein VGY57_02850, partial [Vicinamibacterales bacterium]|nr:hypothetical protein [Vicinamibacterales bacterium]